MLSRPIRRILAAVALLLGAAIYFVLVELHRRTTSPALDIYIYYLPNKLHAVSSVWQGGRGLLWNPFQSCGEPFFANPAMGLLYPLHLLFLVLEPNAAVHVVLIANMLIGATGMLLLARELGLGWSAALAGALIFELGDPMAQLTGWSPMQNGPWAWLPWALLLCERLLRAPSRRLVVGLAAVLTLELMPGWVLITALTYQLIALRVGWELLTTRERRPWRSALAIAAGMALAAGLAAVQLVPAAELSRESVRVAIESIDFLRYRPSAADLFDMLRRRVPPLPFIAAPLLVASLAVFAATNRRLATFYVLVGSLYAVLALGQTTPLFSLYITLPPGISTVRYSTRLFWVTGFSLAILSALALDGLIRRIGHRAAGWLYPIAAAGLALTLFAVVPNGLRWTETAALAAIVAALAVAVARPGLGRPAGWLIVAALGLNLVAVPLHYGGRLLPSVDDYWRHADTIAALDPPLTAQDRLFIAADISSMFDLSLLRKTATLLRLQEIFDYEALLGYRHAQYYGVLWHGRLIRSLDDLNRVMVTGGFRHRLLDLAAVRIVLTTPGASAIDWGLELPEVAISDPGLRVYRNDNALPRARWVPRIEVIEDPGTLINRLAYPPDDLAQVAYVETPPASGFTGDSAPAGSSSVRFVQNDPEHLVIDVDAPARGFLVLADQYYPGWQATVNGAPVPIERANYMFRLVEVPAGASRVEFRYRPASVMIGAAISVVTFVVLAVLFWSGRARPRAL